MAGAVRVRVRESVIVAAPGGGGPVTLRAGAVYHSDDPLVREYGWAFEADNVEAATAAPGERRSVRR